MIKQLIIGTIVLIFVVVSSQASDNLTTFRGETPLNAESAPPMMPKVLNKDIKRKRNYPMQPPTIPHKIDNYQTDLRTNKCLSCHSRKQTEGSQAPMISVTHYMDRDGNFLATVSPRRYFCKQCHVIQTEAKPLVGNNFKDIDELLAVEPAR